MLFTDHYSGPGRAIGHLSMRVCSYDCFRTKWPLT